MAGYRGEPGPAAPPLPRLDHQSVLRPGARGPRPGQPLWPGLLQPGPGYLLRQRHPGLGRHQQDLRHELEVLSHAGPPGGRLPIPGPGLADQQPGEGGGGRMVPDQTPLPLHAGQPGPRH